MPANTSARPAASAAPSPTAPPAPQRPGAAAASPVVAQNVSPSAPPNASPNASPAPAAWTPPPPGAPLEREQSTSVIEISPPPGEETPKYEVEELLAEGAEGRVYLVRDHDLKRRVAMKVIHPDSVGNDRHVQRFLAEARRTASLEHAGVPAVHDLGYSASGELYFTMRFVEGRTLRDVFAALRRGDEATLREWTVVRLVQALQRVAAAVDFAHSRGLLHRDLKPENIALGDFHEVLVLDWGLSKRIGRDEHAAPHSHAEGVYATQIGAVKGTPMYMAPEQARGAVNELDARCDVFSLGAILYEALCLEGPYDGRTADTVIEHARAGRIVPLDTRIASGTNIRDVPRTLAETAMRALSSDPRLRQKTAREFGEDLQAFLEGSRERLLRAEEAQKLLDSAHRLEHRRKDLIAEGERLAALAADLRVQLPPWAPQKEKSRLWALEDAAVRTRVDAADAHARAMDQVARALALDSESKAARDTLALLYYERFVDAERRGNREDAAWLLRMVERYDSGALRAALRENGSFVVTSEPHGARVSLRRLVERDRRLVGEIAADLGRTPLTHDAVASGVYEVVVSHAGYEPALVPIRLRRGERCSIHVAMIPAGSVPPGFLRVTGGPFLAGTDLQPVHVPDFAMMKYPVRLTEYAEFLDDVARTDPDAAAAHVPWVEMHGTLLQPGPGGRHVWSDASPLSQNPITPHADLPVVGVGRASAEAFAEWMTLRTGRRHRLPTELEWEKAARGTDGRLYPWGDAFDPTFCSMVESTETPATLRPVGAFPDDVSPYGVHDLAGGVREWCIDNVVAGRSQAVCRGGAWYLGRRECAVTSRWLVEDETRNPGIGFRLCVDLA